MSANRKSEIGNRQAQGFTLVELLVVITIIAVLIGITIPVVGKIRKSSQEAATRSLIGQIDAACQTYFGDFNAYPGPMSHFVLVAADQTVFNDGIGNASGSNAINPGQTADGYNGVQANGQRLTGAENLVLGLCGGLTFDANRPSPQYTFKPDQVGLGAVRFNPKRPGRANAYMQPTNLSEGKFTDDAGVLNPAKDTIIPEFVDSFTNPMPILYMRARKGGAYDPSPSAGGVGVTNNNIVVDAAADGSNTAEVSRAQYNLQEIAPYTQSSIGVGRSIKPSDYKAHPSSNLASYPHGLININPAATLGSKTGASQYPYNAYAYFTDPSSDNASLSAADRPKAHRARKADGFVLISAGVDRVYGTEDDITNFGDVLP